MLYLAFYQINEYAILLSFEKDATLDGIYIQPMF